MPLDCEGYACPPTLAAYLAATGKLNPKADYRGLSMERLAVAALAMVKPERVNHILGCRDTAVSLAIQWGADPQAAARAGLLHDCTKAMLPAQQLALCREYGISLDTFSQENPKTLHALTGALVAQFFFEEKEDVVQAIRYHTTARANMSLLEKIIYVADYMEPNRSFSGVEKLRQLAVTDINEALRQGLTMTVELLNEQGRAVCPQSVEALAWLDKEDTEKGYCKC